MNTFRPGSLGSAENAPTSPPATNLSLLKTVNYRESLGIFLCDRCTVGRHDHHSVCSRFRALVPVSQPSVAGTRACRPATSADRLAAATSSPPPSSFRRSAPVGVPLPSVWPRVLDALVLVKPATVVKWHRQGFRIYWRWRSRCPGRPRTSAEIRTLIRQMSRANPLWGAPRIHGELPKLGIEVTQASVGRCLPRRPKAPSPTWRSFLRNHMTVIAAVDMFMVATVTFKLLYAVIVLSHHRRRVIHFEVTQNPTQAWLARQIIEAFPGRSSIARSLRRDPSLSTHCVGHPVSGSPVKDRGSRF